MIKSLILLALALLPLAKADPQLDKLHDLLVSMRTAEPSDKARKVRGATPQLTEAKHQLRDWVESRLVTFPADGGTEVYAASLYAELRDAGLTCSWDEPIHCPEWFYMGFIGKIELTRSNGLLILKTSFGIECGFDDSAYIYKRTNQKWQRLWQNEQTAYQEKLYQPQNLVDVSVSPDGQLVMTLGGQPWCSSNWRNVYYRLFRIAIPTPLINESEYAFEPESILGRVTKDEILVEYTIAGINGDTRQRVRHFKIEQNRFQIVDPIALTPRDFVEDWIVRTKRYPTADFDSPTMKCQTPDQWQLSLIPRDSTKHDYFLVEWRPPYHFTMLQVSDHPNPNCTEPDPKADEPQTLFPDRPR